MTDRSLYDEDILLWSEQQAALIRELGRACPDLVSEVDVENVAEEIECVGRRELAAVKGRIRRIFVHLMKLYREPEADAARHWRADILGFHHEATRRYAPSMRQRIDLDGLWRSAGEQARLSYEGTPQQAAVAELRESCPYALDDLIAEPIDSLALMERLRRASGKRR